MIIDISKVAEGHSSFSGSSRLESVREQMPEFSEILYDFESDRNDSFIRLHCRYRGSFQVECSRCLKAVSLPITGEMNLLLQEKPGSSGPAGETDSADFFFDNKYDHVDISSAFFDDIMIAIPLKVLCDEQCKGIVIDDKDISIDLGASEAKKEQIDPRWEALRKLKKNS